jgi:hypothetical protein
MSGPAKKGGWGSFLKQAVEGLESNLDTILSGDDVPQSKAAQSAATPKVAPKPASGKFTVSALKALLTSLSRIAQFIC